MVPLEVVVNNKKQIKFSAFYIWHNLLRPNPMNVRVSFWLPKTPSPCGRKPKMDKKDEFSQISGYVWTGP